MLRSINLCGDGEKLEKGNLVRSSWKKRVEKSTCLINVISV